MRDLGVNTQRVRVSTTEAPADDTHQGQRVALSRISGYQGSATVSLAGVFTSSHEAGTDHVGGHVRVHGAALSIREDSHANLIEN